MPRKFDAAFIGWHNGRRRCINVEQLIGDLPCPLDGFFGWLRIRVIVCGIRKRIILKVVEATLEIVKPSRSPVGDDI